MGGKVNKIYLAVPLPSILQLLLPDVVKEHLSRFPYGPGAESRKTVAVADQLIECSVTFLISCLFQVAFIRIERQTHKAYLPLICRLSCVLFSKVGCLQIRSANRKSDQIKKFVRFAALPQTWHFFGFAICRPKLIL